jgi:hypothetical protein
METKSKDASPERQESYAAAVERASDGTGARAVRTRDHDAVRRWAARHGAEPATGEATVSGPATTHVNDGGTGLRFNFPGLARFRAITWEEWFEHFDGHALVFVYEEEVVDRAYELSQARGGEPGHENDDWFEAERQLGGPTAGPMGRYRILKTSEST